MFAFCVCHGLCRACGSPFHNCKKCISHAARTNKQLFLDRGLVDLQAYKLLGTGDISACLDQLHFPSIDAVDHVDAQSVDNMVQLCAVDATTALRDLPQEKATLSTVATAFWMEQTRRYLLVFMSRRWSLEQRVEEAARIVVFLRIFREHVRQSATLTLEANFLCHQTYTHMLLTLHTVRVADAH